MVNNLLLRIGLISLLPSLSLAQTTPTPITSANYVTEIITTYGGYWKSGNGAKSTTTPTYSNEPISTTKPDNSHLLLAFVVNNGLANASSATAATDKYFSTGVNDALLASRLPAGSYKPGSYQALPVSALSGTITGDTKVALGQLYDGVNGGASSPPPIYGYAQYLTDGTQGLDLGTGVANLPKGSISFTVSSLALSTIGDNQPDILITQIASISAAEDQYQVLDASGTQVTGTKTLSANYSNVLPVGNWTADFYEASKNPMTLGADFTRTDRPLRLLAIDWSVFGVTANNYSSVKQFRITLSGESDQAFIAYNTSSAKLVPLPVQLVAFTGQLQGRSARLAWQTASESNSAYFEVEASADGRTFGPVGRVPAASNSQQPRHYQLDARLLNSGSNYYRLRQADLDGSAHYSPTVVVTAGAAAVEVFPSVFADHLTVRLPACTTAGFTLLSADGRVLRQAELPASAAAQDVALAALAELPTGFYLLRVVVDGQAVLRRLAKQ